MTPRNRKRTNKNLKDTPNLYWTDTTERWLKYVHPLTGKSFGMGSDLKKAKLAAKTLNAQLMPSNDLVSNVLGNSMRMIDFVKYYYDQVIPKKSYAKKTLTLINGQRKHVEAHFGKIDIEDIGVRECDALLDNHPSAMANNYRKLLIDIFRHAIAKGYYTRANPAEMTLRREHTKKRKRMTKDEFDAIRAVAPTWCQHLMDIALITLQREGDLLNFKYDDIKNGRWEFVTQKTKTPLSIPISGQLQKVIDQSRKDEVMSRYVIHYRHFRSKRGPDFGKVNINTFNTIFQELRRESGVYDHLKPGEWPSFHEIRALGTKLYRDADIDPQPILGHSDVAMTDHYDSGHEEIRYVEIDKVIEL